MERESPPRYVIEQMSVDDIEAATVSRLQSWLDTYPNEEYGVTREWIEQRNHNQFSDEKMASRRERFNKSMAEGTMHAWVARDESGHIIGSTTPYQQENGTWRLGSLYVDKAWHGTGVGGKLMAEVASALEGEDIYLGVATYNERAKAFYRKWGFEEIPGSETLFDGKIPEVMMVRKVDNKSIDRGAQ